MPLSTTVRLLPEEVDPSIILTASGLGALAFMTYGALRGYHPDRLRQIVLLGTVVGGVAGTVYFMLALARLIP